MFAGWVFDDGQDYGGDRIETIRPDSGILGKVADNPGAIGHLSFALLGENDSIKRIKPDGQNASVDNADYPITRPLYLITKGEPEGKTADFINWAKGEAGQAVVKKFFVGVKAE